MRKDRQTGSTNFRKASLRLASCKSKVAAAVTPLKSWSIFSSVQRWFCRNMNESSTRSWKNWVRILDWTAKYKSLESRACQMVVNHRTESERKIYFYQGTDSQRRHFCFHSQPVYENLNQDVNYTTGSCKRVIRLWLQWQCSPNKLSQCSSINVESVEWSSENGINVWDEFLGKESQFRFRLREK
jgi:hypothetical protein